MRVAVFGGTGFVGNYIINELLNSGYEVNVLVRPGSENKLEKINNCNVVEGSINQNSTLSCFFKLLDGKN